MKKGINTNVSILGIDIGSKTTKLVVGKMKKGTLEVNSLSCMANEEGVFYDGKIMNSSFAQNSIRESVSRHISASRLVSVCIDSTDVIKREVIIPAVSQEDILGLITYEIAQYLPIDVDSYVVQYKVLEQFDDGSGEKKRVFAGAIPKSVVESYANVNDVLKLENHKMGLHLNMLDSFINFDIERNTESEFNAKNILCVDIGHSFLNMNIFSNGIFMLNRLVETGGGLIDRKIAQLMNMDLKEAERTKISVFSQYSMLDLLRNEIELNDKSAATKKEMMFHEMFLSVDHWVREIYDVINYYTSRGNKIDRIFIYGGCSAVRELDIFIERRLNIETKVLGDLPSINMNKGIDSNVKIANYINAIGAVI